MSFLGMLSPAASSVESSDMTFNSPLSSSSDCMTPYLEMVEQPVDKFRFRYKSEMVGTHGSLTGVNSDIIRKNTYPTVHLHNYDGPAVVRCSLIQIDSDEPHAHRLVTKAGNAEKDDPHDLEVSPEIGFTAMFQGMGIIHTAKKYLKLELAKKKLRLLREALAESFSFTNLTRMQEADVNGHAEDLSKKINLNTVRLKFEAFRMERDVFIPLCLPIYSHGINNLKSALTGELKIGRLDHTVVSCVGGQEIFILVEKVNKTNIKVRFFECDEEDNEIWSAYGRFSQNDVHHQYAIVFKAPPYRDLAIENTVKVFIQLERLSDGERSEPLVFRYKPTDKIGHKRSRPSESCSSNDLPTEINNLSLNNSESIVDYLSPQDLPVCDIIDVEFEILWASFGDEYKKIFEDNLTTDGPATDSSSSMKLSDPESSQIAKKVVSAVQACLKQNQPLKSVERNVNNLFINILTTDGNNALHTSILCNQSQHLKYILFLLNKMKHLKIADIQNNYAETALHLAVKINNPNVVGLLLSVGADSNIVDDKGNTALHLAIDDNLNLDDYKKLLNVTEIDAVNYDGFTPLHLAVLKNNLKSAQMLVSTNADVNAKQASNGNTALHMAVEEKCTEIVQFLLEKTTARLDAENYSKTTPVHMAKILSTEGEASEQILRIVSNYIKDNCFDSLLIKSEPEDDETSSESEGH